MNSPQIFKHIFCLWRYFDERRKWQLSFVLFLMVISSFAEMVTIGSVFPYLGALLNPQKFYSYIETNSFFHIFNVKENFLLVITLIFCIFVFISAGIRIFLLWFSNKTAFQIGADLSIDIYRRTLYQPYLIHIGRNSSELIDAISVKTNAVIYHILNPLMTLISSIILIIFIFFILIYINPKVALILVLVFGSLYLSLILVTKRALHHGGQQVAEESGKTIKLLQEGLGGIREIIINGTQEIYCDFYKKSDVKLRKAQANNYFLGHSPRYAVECLGILLIVATAFLASKNVGGVIGAMPFLGVLALSAQRMLPIFHQSYGAWSSVMSGHASLVDVLKFLDQKPVLFKRHQNSKTLVFKKTITVKDISFAYENQIPVLKKCNFVIRKGERVGFIGKSGSGKTTMTDILMGLLTPQKGQIFIDSKIIDQKNISQWQAQIAHVSQSIFIADATIEENIALGIAPDFIDKKLLERAVKAAKIDEFIRSLPNQYKTMIGERGARLSGGQRQRIGIARALYKNATVIFFDEATSALDTETEKEVMSSIENLDKNLTIFIIAHRLSTLKKCSSFFVFDNGTLKKIQSLDNF
jgi:ABC-type multidrug transport system fused ATPase/permease subunit